MKGSKTDYLKLLNTRKDFLIITDIIKREPATNRINILCKCDCGNEIYLRPSAIRNQKSCGCLRKQTKEVGSKVINRSGLVIDKITVLDEYKIVGEDAHWKIKCECGYEGFKPISKILYHYKRYGQASCGCNKIKYDLPNARNQFSRYKENANRRNLEFNLTLDEFINLTQQQCYYCGCKPNNNGNRSKRNYKVDNFIYNGIDRVDNNLGYVLNNCVPCCISCNKMKLNYTFNEFKNKIIKIYEHLGCNQ